MFIVYKRENIVDIVILSDFGLSMKSTTYSTTIEKVAWWHNPSSLSANINLKSQVSGSNPHHGNIIFSKSQ